jgi:single-strand selective monofunctional uracil DNA glycosylase
MLAMSCIDISRKLCQDVKDLTFKEPVTHVYNPLEYAQASHENYLRKYAHEGVQVVLLGMNPGPWGMAQTGVPFGEVAAARDWLKVGAEVGRPKVEHPKRPVQGFDCTRSEVSGRRLWAWAMERFENPEAFFKQFFVLNYCPLSFMEESGRNRIPEKLPASERAPLFKACDEALVATVEFLKPEWVLGVGGFAEKQARKVLDRRGLKFGKILHPSPASPAANRGWAPAAEKQLTDLGLL